jgi:protein-S-isoprenylcysteine O-methyltransferase Ste14
VENIRIHPGSGGRIVFVRSARTSFQARLPVRHFTTFTCLSIPIASSFSSFLVKAGRRIFGSRLFVGVAIAIPGIEWLSPVPFFSEGHRLVQSIAIVLALLGLALRAWASGCAGRHTRTAEIEAPQLVTDGPFAYMRNPIYVGTICLGFGIAALIGDPRAFLLAAIAFLVLYLAIVPAEEEFLGRRFGTAYARYRAEVPRFLPRLRPWPGRVKHPFHWTAVRGEIVVALWAVGIYLAILAEEQWIDKVWG